jgi:hypothetical protein
MSKLTPDDFDGPLPSVPKPPVVTIPAQRRGRPPGEPTQSILIGLPPDDVAALDAIAKERGVSRRALIRRVLADYILGTVP